MISLDGSVIAAIIIFILLIFTLNQLLFKPIIKIQAERETRTTGLMARMKEKMDNQSGLFNAYQSAIKNARMEGYRRQDELRAEAMKKKAEMLARTRKEAEELMQNSRNSIQSQVEDAKKQLFLESREMARKITTTILERSALDA